MFRNALLLILAAATIAMVAIAPSAKSQANSGPAVSQAAPVGAIALPSAFDYQQHTPFSGQITDYGYGGGSGSLSSLLRPGPTATAIDLNPNALGGFTLPGGIATGAQ
jgi:hypothetical protein